MKYIITLLAALTMATTVQAKAPQDEQCSQATNIAVTTFEARKNGMTEEMAMHMLGEQKIYSGVIVWAVKQGLRAPADLPEFMFRGMIFGECMKRTDL